MTLSTMVSSNPARVMKQLFSHSTPVSMFRSHPLRLIGALYFLTQGLALSPTYAQSTQDSQAVAVTSSATQVGSQTQAQKYPVCNSEPTDTDTLGAKSAYKVGQISFQEADYNRAILYWEDAFTRDCTALALLLNLARAYELNGQLNYAINALEAYLEREAAVKNRPAIEKRIAKLRQRSEAQKREKAVVAATKVSEADEPSIAAEPKARPLAPVLITSAGLLGASLGGLFYGLSRPTLKDCDTKAKTCTNDQATNKATSALGLRNTGYDLLATGGSAFIAGAIYWTLSWQKPDKKASSSLFPVLTPEYQGIQFNAQF